LRVPADLDTVLTALYVLIGGGGAGLPGHLVPLTASYPSSPTSISIPHCWCPGGSSAVGFATAAPPPACRGMPRTGVDAAAHLAASAGRCGSLARREAGRPVRPS